MPKSKEELEREAQTVWNQYWGAAQVTGLAAKLPKALEPYLEVFFKAGFVEGYRTKEEEQ
jgi:hypothetical protein